MKAPLAAVLSLCAGCAAESVERPPLPPADWASLEARPPPPPPDAGSPTQREREAAQAYLEALSSSGFVKLLPLLAEEVHFTAGDGHDALGPEAVVKAHDARLGRLEERRFTPTRVLQAESSLVLEWTLTAVHGTSHRNVALRGVALLWTKDSGAITDVHLLFDEAVLRAQLGEGPKGFAAPALPPAPSGSPERFEQAGGAQEDRGAATVRRSLDALENNDEPGYLATMTDGVEWVTLEASEPLKGAAIARAYFRTMRKALGNLDTQIDHAWAAGPYVAVEYRITGEQRGPIGWVPAQKNKLVDLRVVDVCELRDAKIVRLWRYEDPASIAPGPGGTR
jgi:ketosteroid isomerase-like protein